MRLIDADALKAKFPFFFEGTVSLEKVAQNIDNAPTIDPVKHGRWVPLYDDVWECSECEQGEQFAENIESTSRYCPNCGARMDGDEESTALEGRQ